MGDRKSSRAHKKERESTVNILDITTQISAEDSFVLVKDRRLKVNVASSWTGFYSLQKVSFAHLHCYSAFLLLFGVELIL